MNRPNKKRYEGQIVGYSQHLDKYVDYLENQKEELLNLIKRANSTIRLFSDSFSKELSDEIDKATKD